MCVSVGGEGQRFVLASLEQVVEEVGGFLTVLVIDSGRSNELGKSVSGHVSLNTLVVPGVQIEVLVQVLDHVELSVLVVALLHRFEELDAHTAVLDDSIDEGEAEADQLSVAAHLSDNADEGAHERLHFLIVLSGVQVGSLIFVVHLNELLDLLG